MAVSTLASGNKVSIMDKESACGATAESMLESGTWGRLTAKERRRIQMVPFVTMVNGASILL